MGPESRDSQGQPAEPDEPLLVRVERDHRRIVDFHLEELELKSLRREHRRVSRSTGLGMRTLGVVKTGDWGIVRGERYRFASRGPGAPGIPVQGAAPRALP